MKVYFQTLRRITAAALVVTALMTAARVRAEAPADTLRISVDDAVRYALRQGVEAAMARQDVAAANAGVGVALSYGLPQIDLSAVYTRNLKKPVIFFELEPGKTQAIELGEDNAYNAGITLRQSIYSFGRVGSGYRMAKEREVAAMLAGDAAAAGIARNVKIAYHMALLAQEQTAIARRSLEQARRNVEQIAARVEQGVTPEFEQIRAGVSVANRKPVLSRAKNQEAIAFESLKRLLGMPLDRPIALTDRLELIRYLESRDVTVQHALNSRKDLAAVRGEMRASEYQLRAQSANDRPLLYLDGGYQWQGQTSSGLFPGDNESAQSASVGLSLVWPILDGFRNRNQTRQAEAALKKARLAVRRYEDMVRLEVRSNWANVYSTEEEIDGASEAVRMAEKAFRIAQVRYDTGLSTLLEYLDSELALFQAQLTLSETLYRYNVSLANLEFSIGEGPKLGSQSGDN